MSVRLSSQEILLYKYRTLSHHHPPRHQSIAQSVESLLYPPNIKAFSRGLSYPQIPIMVAALNLALVISAGFAAMSSATNVVSLISILFLHNLQS